MVNFSDVGRPLPVPGIHGSSKQELFFQMAACRFKKELIDFVLTVLGKCSHIAQVAIELSGRFHSNVNIRVNTSIKRTDHACVIFLLQLPQHISSRERKEEIES